MAPRLTLIPGQPVMPCDVIGATTLYYSDVGVTGPSLNLSGRAAGSLHDVFDDGAQIFTVPMPAMEAPVTGTPIGGMIANGGLAAAFDGVVSKNYLASARSPGAVTGFSIDGAIGLSLSTPTPVTRIRITGPTNSGINGGGQKCPWQWLGSNTNDITTGTIIAEGLTPPSASTALTTLDAQFPSGSAFSNYWFRAYGNGLNAIYVAQLQPFTTLPISARGLVAVGDDLTNAAAITGQGNSGTVAVAAQGAKYRGTIQIGDTAGQMDFTLDYGSKRRIPIWNAKNRVRVSLTAGDSTRNVGGHWTYTVAQALDYAFAPVRGNDAIHLRLVSGLPEDSASLAYKQTAFQDSVNTAAVTAYWCGIGVDSKTTPSGFWPSINYDTKGNAVGQPSPASHKLPPFYGSRTIYALEGGRGNVSGSWGAWNQELTADWSY